jgi:hypothetical protein
VLTLLLLLNLTSSLHQFEQTSSSRLTMKKTKIEK